MKRRWIITIGLLLFMGLNVLLLIIDKDGKVERTAYVSDWTATVTEDMSEHVHKQGVLTAAEKNPIYFDETEGSFKEFLVKEGEKVNKGDPLFSYKVSDYENTKMKLETESDQLNDEIAAIEKAITTISSHEIPDTDSSPEKEDALENTVPGEDKQKPTTNQTAYATYLKEQYVTEKEKELSQKQAQLDNVRAQLTELETNGDTVTIESPYEGRVAARSDELSKPIMTIESTALRIQGELTERERMVLESGMPTDIAISEGNKELTGTIQEIEDSPENVTLNEANAYPFYVALTDDADTKALLPGYHADLSITAKESKGAITAADRAIFDNTVWVMTAQGKLKKQAVATGIEQHDQTELEKGIGPGEWLAADDAGYYRTGERFITPIKGRQVPLRSFFKQKDWKQAIAIGFLTR